MVGTCLFFYLFGDIVATVTEVSVICDSCGQPINTDGSLYFDAGVYGVELHLECLDKLSAKQLIVILSLDDTYVAKRGEYDRGMKANSYFRRHS